MLSSLYGGLDVGELLAGRARSVSEQFGPGGGAAALSSSQPTWMSNGNTLVESTVLILPSDFSVMKVLPLTDTW